MGVDSQGHRLQILGMSRRPWHRAGCPLSPLNMMLSGPFPAGAACCFLCSPLAPLDTPKPRRAAKRLLVLPGHTSSLPFSDSRHNTKLVIDGQIRVLEALLGFFFSLWNLSKGSLGLKHRHLNSRQLAKACVVSQTMSTGKLHTGSAAALLGAPCADTCGWAGTSSPAVLRKLRHCDICHLSCPWASTLWS